MSILIPPFGMIPETGLDPFYSARLKVGSFDVEITLNFDSEDVDPDTLKHVNVFIAKIDALAADASKAIAKDFDAATHSEVAQPYLDHCAEELSEVQLLSVFGSAQVNRKRFIDALVLHRVSLYPEDDGSFAMLDYGLPPGYTDYLIAVYFDRNGHLTDIAVES